MKFHNKTKEQEDHAFCWVSLPNYCTGLPVNLWLDEMGERRLKKTFIKIVNKENLVPQVMIQNDRFKLRTLDIFYMSISKNPSVLDNGEVKLPKKEFQEISEFIITHYDLLMRHWNGEHEVYYNELNNLFPYPPDIYPFPQLTEKQKNNRILKYFASKKKIELDKWANLANYHTKLPVGIWVSDLGYKEKGLFSRPRIKVQNSTTKKSILDTFTISINKTPRIIFGICKISKKNLNDVYNFIIDNYDLLIDHWNYKIHSNDLRNLFPIPEDIIFPLE